MQREIQPHALRHKGIRIQVIELQMRCVVRTPAIAQSVVAGGILGLIVADEVQRLPAIHGEVCIVP